MNFINVKKKIFIMAMIGLTSFLLLLLFISLFSLISIGFSVLTIGLTFVISSLTTLSYQKNNQDVLLKRISISKYNLNFLKLKMFLEIFFYGLFYVIFWLFLVYFFSLKEWGVDPTIDHEVIVWNNFSFIMYFYYGSMEVIMIIIFFYLLNHFLNNINLIYIFIIGVTIYFIVYATLVYNTIQIRTYNDYAIWCWIDDNKKTRIIINTILFPWSSLSMFGENVFYSASKIAGKVNNVHWFSMKNMNVINNTTYGYFFTTIIWNPFVISFVPFLMVNFYRFFSKKVKF